LVGGFHLPSAVCPPSVFGDVPSDRVWQEPRALDGPGAKSFMTHNPHPGAEIGRLLPTSVRPCPPSEFAGGCRRREGRPDARRSLGGHPQVVTNADERRSARRRSRRRRRLRPSVRSQSARVTNQTPCAQLGLRSKGPEFGPQSRREVAAPSWRGNALSNKSPMRCPNLSVGSTFRPSPLHLRRSTEHLLGLGSSSGSPYWIDHQRDGQKESVRATFRPPSVLLRRSTGSRRCVTAHSLPRLGGRFPRETVVAHRGINWGWTTIEGRSS
jgi:hypothetical protein